ncbi:MAG: response regulator transcription factor [Butyrivibrio sp.]|nr:response regulator transcription factor [Butyrivibrio sp.]
MKRIVFIFCRGYNIPKEYGMDDRIMALTVAVVDDDAKQTEYLTGLVNEWADSRRMAVDVRGYKNAEAFLFDYEDRQCDLLLLDIEMEGINGMELAKKLRAKGDNLPIVFITGFADYMSEGYDVEALHYLLKPLDCEKFGRVLDRYADRRGSTDEELVAETENGSMHIRVSDIMYAEAFGRSSRLYMSDGKKTDCRAGIGELRAELPASDFVSCHRSYIVNLRYVRTVNRTELTLDDGSVVLISRRLYGEVCRAFAAYYTSKKGGVE